MNKAFFIEMLNTPSVSGHEVILQKKIMNYLQNDADTFLCDYRGNVIAKKNHHQSLNVLMCGHVDEIGLSITNVTSDGFIKVVSVGGIRSALYLGAQVKIMHNDTLIHGVVGCNSHLIKNKDLTDKDLFIDIGAKNKEEALQHIAIGDPVYLHHQPEALLNDCIVARGLDNRAGAFIVSEVFKELANEKCNVNVYSATTTGEETNMDGAYMSASKVKPDLAIIVDVTFTNDYPGVGQEVANDIVIGGGPVLCHSTIINRKVNDQLALIAEKLGINIQYENAIARTGTDGDKVHFTNEGVMVCLVSIPLRYMHSGNEVVSLQDIESIIALIKQFILELKDLEEFDLFK